MNEMPTTTPRKRPKITQEMIKLYDDYTHLTLDRRDFMQKLTAADRLGGGRGGGRADARGEPGARGDRRGGRSAGEGRDDHLARRRRADDERLSGAAGRRDRQAAGGDRGPREPRAQSAHQGRGAAHGARRLPGARAGFPDARRRHAGGRGEGARDDRRARPRADRRQCRGDGGVPEEPRGLERQGRHHRLLLGRRHGEPDGRARRRRSRGGRRLLRLAAGGERRQPRSRRS